MSEDIRIHEARGPMTCEAVREQLPDLALGTLAEGEAGGVRRHLRGCAPCRADLAGLDSGLAMFATAAHAVDPPAALKDRVLSVLHDEWREAGPSPVRRRGIPPARRWLAVAAVVVALGGAVTWGAVSSSVAHRNAAQALDYRTFLSTLGGKDVRVAALSSPPTSALTVEGSAVLYDSDLGQSWVLVLLRATGYRGTANVSLSSGQHVLRLHPTTFDSDGSASAWLVTSGNIQRLDHIRVTAPDGTVLATGVAHYGHSS
jgi:hypothetical protein